MTRIVDNFDNDIAFDADDVDLGDMIVRSIGVHGTMCPDVVNRDDDVLWRHLDNDNDDHATRHAWPAITIGGGNVA